MKSNSLWLPSLPVLLLAVFALGAPGVRAGERIKLATLAPTGSTYHKSLLAMREAWRKASNGEVDLVVYPDGKLGGEADTVGLMSIRSIQASLLTAVGLAEIDSNVGGLQYIPMGFHDLAAVDYVGQHLQPMLEKRLEAKGFVVLFWVDAGWVRFFSKQPVLHPDDLRKLKLFAWAGNPEAISIYKSAGFDAVPLETADILPSLQTGLIDAAPLPPVFALKGQIDTRAPYMLELNWGPLVGACVVRKDVWEKLAPRLREELLKIAVAIGKEIKANGRKEMDDSVKAMEKRGLTVTRVPPGVEAEWRAAAEAVYPLIRDKIVPADIFDRALALIKEHRSAAATP